MRFNMTHLRILAMFEVDFLEKYIFYYIIASLIQFNLSPADALYIKLNTTRIVTIFKK